ncbi:hypothetical protein V8C34DRAFT_271129 [Trichoderma compactum]
MSWSRAPVRYPLLSILFRRTHLLDLFPSSALLLHHFLTSPWVIGNSWATEWLFAGTLYYYHRFLLLCLHHHVHDLLGKIHTNVIFFYFPPAGKQIISRHSTYGKMPDAPYTSGLT